MLRMDSFASASSRLAVILLLLWCSIPGHHAQINTFPYLETFDATPTCADCSTGGTESDCTQIATDLGWEQEDAQDTADTNWIVWSGNTPTPGTGPKTGDHTSGSGNYLWLHQGTGVAANCDDDDGAPYCETSPEAFVDQTVGIVSPVFDFSAVPSTDTIFLRFWYWMFGLRTGYLHVSMSTTASVDGPWTTNLTTIAVDRPEWRAAIVPLTGAQGQSTVRLRFLAEFLPTYCTGGSPFCVYCGTSPHPDDMADQAFDDVEIFLSSGAPTVTAGSEDRAIWVDLTARDALSGVVPFASEQAGAWLNFASSFGSNRMALWGGVSETGEAIDSFRLFDYVNRQFTQELSTGQVPIPRRRSAFGTLAAGPNQTDPAATLVLYGGRGKFGITQALLSLDVESGSFEPGSGAPLNCTDLTPLERSHVTFPAEGAQTVLDPADSTGQTFYVTMGRSLVVQVNFITRYQFSNLTDGTCTSQVLLPMNGTAPPMARWQHVATGWVDPSDNNTYLFLFGGRFQPSDNDPLVALSDLQIFDLALLQWRPALIVADPLQKPSPRFGTAAATNAIGDKWVLFGGQDAAGSVYSDVYVLQFNLVFELWKLLSPGLDVGSVPGRVHALMLPMFFSDTTLDPTAPVSENSEGFMVFGGVEPSGQVSNHMAKLHFGDLDLSPVDSGDDEEDPTIAIVLGVVLPFCCLLLLLLLAVAAAIGILLGWRSLAKKRLKRKYHIGQEYNTADTPLTEMTDEQGD